MTMQGLENLLYISKVMSFSRDENRRKKCERVLDKAQKKGRVA